jgi:aspartyl-tRNA(Asn)/glutamyl-tRNA(Gln) amidotransferase subunit A
MSSLYALSASEVVTRIKKGEISAVDYIATIIERIEEVDGGLKAFISVSKSLALSKAREIDRKLKKGEKTGRLTGVAIAIKDNICWTGLPTTCSSRMLANFISPYNATVVNRILKEDAVIVGKTNMDEFAMGSSTESSFWGPTKNPWDTMRVPGGSSGGSAVAVAADEVPLALGSDTGGSVRCPASFCSVVGLKPTYGRISRYGLIAYANSLEQIGPFAANVQDCALLLEVISGHDVKDGTSLQVKTGGFTQRLDDDVQKLKIGVPKEFFDKGVDEHIAQNVWNTIHSLEKLGASYEEISLPILKYALAAYYLIAMSEASSNLARYDGLRYGYSGKKVGEDWNAMFSKNRREGFGAEVRRRIILGTYALSAGYYNRYYLKALQVRTLIREELTKAFDTCDVIVGPTMPMLPFKLGEKIDDPLTLYMCDILTVPANLVNCPAISIPNGFINGLPVGIQAMAPFLREDRLFRFGCAIEGMGKR